MHSAVQYNYNTLLSKGVTSLRVILEKQPVFLQMPQPITASRLFPCSCIFFSSQTDIRRPFWPLAVTIDTRGPKLKHSRHMKSPHCETEATSGSEETPALLSVKCWGTFKKSGIDLFCCSISTPWPVEGVAVTILSSCVDTTSWKEACRRNSDFEDNILGLTLC